MVKEWMFGLLFFCLLFPTTKGFTQSNDENLEWKVKVGDKKTYEIKKINLNGTHEDTVEIDTKEGEVNVTLKKGSKMTIEITILNETEFAYGIVKYDNIKAIERDISYFIMPTTNNMTYWEEWAAAEEDEWYEENTTYSCWVEEEYITVEHSVNFEDFYSESLVTRNWKTGWLVRHYNLFHDYEEGVFEVLLEEAKQEDMFSIPIDIPQPIFFLIACSSALCAGMGLAYLYEKIIKL
ncbi:MAG: hypothetical protein ACFFCQ_09925 [Promethearchaeota archaeon]